VFPVTLSINSANLLYSQNRMVCVRCPHLSAFLPSIKGFIRREKLYGQQKSRIIITKDGRSLVVSVHACQIHGLVRAARFS
jgi:hypothetical protein